MDFDGFGMDRGWTWSHTLWDGIVDDNSLTTTGAAWMRAAAERSTRLTDLDQDTIAVVTLGGSMPSNARATGRE